MMHRERERLLDAEIAKLHARLTDTADEINRRLMQREMKQREEIVEKFAVLEKVRETLFLVRLS